MSESATVPKRDLSISMSAANFYGLFISVPVVFLAAVLLIGVCGSEEVIQGLRRIFRAPVPVVVATLAGLLTQLDGWLRDGGAAHVASLCEWE